MLIERILEDFETLDINTIQEYSRSRIVGEGYSNASQEVHDCSNIPAPSKYYLILRQSVTKYDMFQRQQVTIFNHSHYLYTYLIPKNKLRLGIV